MSAIASSVSRYATGPFPAIRTDGVAKVSSGAKLAADPSVTLVRLVATKDEVKAAAGSGLAAADAGADSVTVTYSTLGGVEQRVLLAAVGATKTKPAKLEGVRKAVAAVVAKARALKLKGIVEFEGLPAIEGASPAQVADAITQAATLANFAFDRYITGADKAPHLLEAFHVVIGEDAAVAAAVSTAKALTDASLLARQVATERADEMNPEAIEVLARRIAAENGMEVHTIVGEELEAAGMHMHYSVGQAAKKAPRYIEVVHRGDPAHPDDVIAIVGKGITFDTGGLNLKPTGSIEEMHMDKGGASAVIGLMQVVGRARVGKNVVFALAVAENAIDADAYKPFCIMRSKKGLTVLNGNTDAEGRLVLADTLYAVQERHRPHTIIDLATLTGACCIALGEYAGGAFTNSKALREAVIAAGATRGETLWAMPILPEHRAELTSELLADLKSTGKGRYGGACTAAAFLENFIGLKEEKPAEGAAEAAKPAWLHLDIAGPGMVGGQGTGFGVLSVAQYLMTAPAARLSADE